VSGARWYRPLTGMERAVVLDAARGLTAAQSGQKRGLTMHQVYELHKRLRNDTGAKSLPNLVALAIASGDIGFHEIVNEKGGAR